MTEKNILEDLTTVILEGNTAGLEYLVNNDSDSLLGTDVFRNYLPNGLPPLHYACQLGHLSLVKWMLEYGADVDWWEEGLPTPLFFAAAHGRSNLIAFLINCGADPNYVYEEFDGYGNMVVQSLPLAESLFNEHFETADLLLEHGASGDVTRGTAALDPFDQYVGVNIKPSLHMAIDSKNYYLLHRLLRAGANPCEEQVNETKEAHISALGYSLLGKEYKALEIILEGGGSPNSQFTVDANYYPYFPVEYAAEKHDWKALQILLSFNPDLELICEDGWSLRVVISKAYAANAAQLSC